MVELLSHAFVHEMVHRGIRGNVLTAMVLDELRTAACRPSLRLIINNHIDTPIRYRTVPENFMHVVLPGLALLATETASLKSYCDPRLFSIVLPEQLESSNVDQRNEAGKQSKHIFISLVTVS